MHGFILDYRRKDAIKMKTIVCEASYDVIWIGIKKASEWNTKKIMATERHCKKSQGWSSNKLNIYVKTKTCPQSMMWCMSITYYIAMHTYAFIFIKRFTIMTIVAPHLLVSLVIVVIGHC